MSKPSSPSLPFRGVQESLSGVVERVTYHDEDTGFAVLRVKVRGRRDLATVVGRAPSVTVGEWVQGSGRWQTDRVHGPQFRAEELAISAPTSRKGMERYLGSGSIAGVGPSLAERLVEAFGDSVFEVIEQEPERLREVRGVGAVRAERIVSGWGDQKRVREIMLFLHSHGVGTARAVRIHRTYGASAVEKIRSDPYRLARDIRGIGFATADALAKSLGVAKTAPSRARAGLRHVLSEAVSDGHCGLPEAELREASEKLLGVSSSSIEATLAGEVAAGELVADEVSGTPCVFLPGLYGAERLAARRLIDLSRGRPPWPTIDAGIAIGWVEARLGIDLAASQREALETALRSKVLVLTGGPGVGKTTLVNSLLEILRAKDVETALAAPTARAAKRLAEATGLPASTLHRLLESDPRAGGFKRNESNPLKCDLLVVDESSMLDVSLLASVVLAVPPHAALLLVGDVDQLPSVGPGRVLADTIDSGALPVVRLREVFRQAAESHIVRNAHRINQGQMPDLEASPDGDFFFVEVDEPERAAERLVSVVTERIPKRFGLDPVRDIQVLSPMHRGVLGARSLNQRLQAALNPPNSANPQVERFGWIYSVGDKVMQIENDRERDVYNGDLGRVCAVESDARELTVRFEGGEDREVRYGFDELDSLVLAYAITVHKAQGSEYPAVVIPISTQHYPMLKRNLVYTAITRGKRLVVLVGESRALSIAVTGQGESRRCSKLRDWLVSRDQGDV